MTVYGCPYCLERHDRLTSISVHGAIYYGDNGVATSEVGCCGCPQCATNSCADCAEETEFICPCGGEFVPNMMYRYSGDGRLPNELADLPTTVERLAALEVLRQRQPMIVAEYRHYKGLIEQCERIAQDEGGDLPRNPGLSLLRSQSDPYGTSPAEAWGLLCEYAVASNVHSMLDLLDDRCLRFAIDGLSDYPTSDDAWRDLLDEYHSPKYHPDHLVPRRSAKDLYRQSRTFVELLREAIEPHRKRLSLNGDSGDN